MLGQAAASRGRHGSWDDEQLLWGEEHCEGGTAGLRREEASRVPSPVALHQRMGGCQAGKAGCSTGPGGKAAESPLPPPFCRPRERCWGGSSDDGSPAPSSSSSSLQVVGQEAPGGTNKGSLKLRINLAKPKKEKEKEKLQKQRSGGVTPGNLAARPASERAGHGIAAPGQRSTGVGQLALPKWQPASPQLGVQWESSLWPGCCFPGWGRSPLGRRPRSPKATSTRVSGKGRPRSCRDHANSRELPPLQAQGGRTWEHLGAAGCGPEMSSREGLEAPLLPPRGRTVMSHSSPFVPSAL